MRTRGMGLDLAWPRRLDARDPPVTITGATARTYLLALRWFGHRNAPGARLRRRLVRLAHDPAGVPEGTFEVPFFGARYRGGFRDPEDWSVFFFSGPDRRVLRLLADVSARRGPKTVFLDIGAGGGAHTLFMATRAAFVHACEPSAAARARLLDKVELNALNNVAVHPVGLAERDTLFPDAEGGIMPLAAGDAWLAGRGVRRVHLIRIGPAAHAASVLAGLKRTLWACRPILLVTFSPSARRAIADRGVLEAGLPPAYVSFALTGSEASYRLQPIAPDWPGQRRRERRATTFLLVPGEWAGVAPRRELRR
jgi:hypothetical protein